MEINGDIQPNTQHQPSQKKSELKPSNPFLEQPYKSSVKKPMEVEGEQPPPNPPVQQNPIPNNENTCPNVSNNKRNSTIIPLSLFDDD